MKILLVSATTFEVAPLVNLIGLPKVVNSHLSCYYTKDHQIDVLVTGVGMVFTTFHLSNTLAHQTYDLAINVGVAGAIDRQLIIGEVINVVQDYFYELGAEDGNEWLTINDLGLINENDFPYANNGLKNEQLPPITALKYLKQVTGQTVNKVHGQVESIKLLRERSKAQIESMEGAAFLYCCMHHQLPCVQIRAISNYVEPRNKANWKMNEAIISLNDFLIQSLLA
jgi:futalosine hydrolase